MTESQGPIISINLYGKHVEPSQTQKNKLS